MNGRPIGSARFKVVPMARARAEFTTALKRHGTDLLFRAVLFLILRSQFRRGLAT
jgi:hypothetical protein